MKKIIIALCLSLILIISLVSCGEKDNNGGSQSSDTQNEGMITDTGTDTNIIEGVESGVRNFGDDIMGK